MDTVGSARPRSTPRDSVLYAGVRNLLLGDVARFKLNVCQAICLVCTWGYLGEDITEIWYFKTIEDSGQIVCITLENSCKLASGLTWSLVVWAGSVHGQGRQKPNIAGDSNSKHFPAVFFLSEPLGAGLIIASAVKALHTNFHYSSLHPHHYCCLLCPPLRCAFSSSSGSASLGGKINFDCILENPWVTLLQLWKSLIGPKYLSSQGL